MAESKDKRTRELREQRRKKKRQARRARARSLRARASGDRRGYLSARNKARELNREAQDVLVHIRARRRSLKHRIGLKPKSGTVWFDGKEVAGWIAPILAAARESGMWKGRVSSGFRSYAKQWWIYYVARIRPAALPGRSNHEGSDYPRGAVDVTDPWGLNRYLDSHGISKLKWYRDTLGPGDDWHFSGSGR